MPDIDWNFKENLLEFCLLSNAIWREKTVFIDVENYFSLVYYNALTFV